MTTQIQIRRGTAAQWTASNPTLTAGELAAETDTGKFKIGNGTSNWATLAYSSGAQGAAGPTYLEVKTPVNVSPGTSATGIGSAPALTASAYYTLYGFTMAASQWQVSAVADFATTVLSTGDVAGTAVTYSMASGLVLANSTYYWRVRYKDANGAYSSWSTATAFTTATSFGPTTIGQAYGGGYYAGIISQGGSQYYVIVSPKASGETLGPSGAGLAYKITADIAPGATITLNNGPAASASMNSTTYPAAYFCENLTIGGYTDWYLPARDELEVCYRNLKPGTAINDVRTRAPSAYTYSEGNDVSGDTVGINRNSIPVGAAYPATNTNPAQTTVTLFQTGNSEAFDTGSYWCSTEYSSTNVWRQNFMNGWQPTNTKDFGWNVRAVRRVAV